MRFTHGRCRPCGVIWKWDGRPRLREALCPTCLAPLDRTAANLATRIPMKEGVAWRPSTGGPARSRVSP